MSLKMDTNCFNIVLRANLYFVVNWCFHLCKLITTKFFFNKFNTISIKIINFYIINYPLLAVYKSNLTQHSQPGGCQCICHNMAIVDL